MFFSLKRLGLLSALCILLAASTTVFAGDEWREVTPAELQMKTPKVEPGADAEAIFWEVRVDDKSVEALALNHYVRVKIFTEKGRDDYIKHDIVFVKGTRIKEVEARVIKPDGTIVLLKKEDVHEREILKANGYKVRAKSFALPGLEVGSVIEYRYREMIDNAEANMRLIFQQEIPIQTISYYVRPYAGTRQMMGHPFNMGSTRFEEDKNGFSRATMTNVPAFREEPSMMPEDQVRSWVYIYYTARQETSPEEYWKTISKSLAEVSKTTLKAGDEVKAATAQAIAGATTDDEKLRKIYEYAQTQIKNLTYTDGATDEEWKKVNGAKTANDTLKLKMGSAGDVDNVFGAMARAAGFDARFAISGSRNELFFDPKVTNWRLMLNSSSIAVKVGNEWRFFSPAAYYIPYGMLSWAEEDQTALIPDQKELIWQRIPLSESSKSMQKSTGKFKLMEDGSLEGEARIEFTGHLAARHRSINRGDTPAEQENTMRTFIAERIYSTAEVTSFTIENPTEPAKPFAYNFKVRVPGFATRTGKRIFIQPNVFLRNTKPRFTATNRKYDVYISYPWAEEEELTIDIPPGFELENPDRPLDIKDSQGIGSHVVKIQVTGDKKTLVYGRKFSFGNGGYIHFPVGSYAQVKAFFEAFNKADIHQLTLRQNTPVPAN